MMRADDGCIDHLQSRVTHSASSECLQDHIPQAAVGPPTELTKDRIPVAKFLRQIAPGRAGSHQPKHRVEHAAMIARWSATTPYQERLEIRPLIVGHQSANHGRSPQRAALNQFAIPASIDLSTRPNPTAVVIAPVSATVRRVDGGFVEITRLIDELRHNVSEVRNWRHPEIPDP